MKLPSKNILVIGGVSLAVVSAAVAFKIKESGVLNEKPQLVSLIAIGSSTIKVPIRPRSFYESSTSANKPSTLTEKISQNFFLNFADLQNQGKWDTDNQAALIKNISDSYATTSVTQVVKLSDIAVFSDRDTVKSHAFGNAVADTIKKYSANLKVSPIDVITDSINGKIEPAQLPEKLAPISDAYAALARDLSRISAPATQAGAFVDLINSYAALGTSVNDMSAYYTDAARAVFGATSYQTYFVNIYNLLKSTADYFKSNGILFTNTESGSIWSSLLQ